MVRPRIPWVEDIKLSGNKTDFESGEWLVLGKVEQQLSSHSNKEQQAKSNGKTW